MDISQFSQNSVAGTSPLGLQCGVSNKHQSDYNNQSSSALLQLLLSWQQDFVAENSIKPDRGIEKRPQTSVFSQLYEAKRLESSLKVSFGGLKDIYEKTQIRTGRKSKQRFVKGTGLVKIKVASEASILGVDVYVERVKEAAALCGDKNGQVPLRTWNETFDCCKQTFSVDLDSVYKSPKGTEVYKLSTVDAARRNRFRLVVVVVFIDGTRSKPFNSKPFILKSRRKEQKEPNNNCSI